MNGDSKISPLWCDYTESVVHKWSSLFQIPQDRYVGRNKYVPFFCMAYGLLTNKQLLFSAESYADLKTSHGGT